MNKLCVKASVCWTRRKILLLVLPHAGRTKSSLARSASLSVNGRCSAVETFQLQLSEAPGRIKSRLECIYLDFALLREFVSRWQEAGHEELRLSRLPSDNR